MRNRLLFLITFFFVYQAKGQVPGSNRDSVLQNGWKLSRPALKAMEAGGFSASNYILSSIDWKKLYLELKSNKNVEIIQVDQPSHSIIIRTKTKSALKQLLTSENIIFIDKSEPAHTEIGIIGYDRSFHGINAVDYQIPGANGKNIVAGVKEQKMEEFDLDLWKRVLPSPIASSSVSNHATVISSIIGGAGNSFYDGRGLAWGAKFFPSSFANLFPDDLTVLHSNRVTVQNHSYGTVIQQFYGAEAVSYDVQTWTDKTLLHVFSAGNQGSLAANEGQYANLPGFANLTGNFKMAKNVLTVGAIDNKGNIPLESSSGPAYDGRIAPQLIALGPNGTSDAAAVVSGTIAVMQQVYADSNNQTLPAASLIKSILYNTTEDVNVKGIDYKTGYGLLDSYKAIRSLLQKNYDGSTLAPFQEWTKNIQVPPNTADLRITLSWADTAAVVNNVKALVNDLDLELKDLSTGMIYQPWVLSTTARTDSLVKPASRKRDSLNTAEQVSVHLPAPGNYEVRVKANSIAGSAVPFHIAWNMDTLNTFYFTSPQHTSDINRHENPVLTIRWNTYVADTNQAGNLMISYNRGMSWQVIAPNYKIYRNQFQWNIKDTSSTGVFKMETSFGNFYSKEFIISPVLSPVVDFICTDSFRISWNKHVYANNYRVWTLTDSPYLKPILVVNDTFVVIRRNQFPGKVYAVEPILINGIPATRSMAFDIDLQGANCFYRTLVYNLLDQNRLKLILTLGVTSYIDSVYFERVTASGNLLEIYGSAGVIDNVLQYDQFVNKLNPGITYVRARIKLKTGEFVYTYILPVLTSGSGPIVFYPNLVRRGESLNYVFRQGLQPGVTIRFFDINGRLLRVAELGVNIDSNLFPPGVIIYKFFNGDNNLLGTGKIMVL